MNGGENLRLLNTFIKFATVVMQLHMWSELLVPLLNMIKEGCENKPALLILLIFFFFFKSQKFNLSLN